MHRVFGTKIDGADYYHRPGAYVIPWRDGKIAAVRIPLGYFLLGGGKEKAESGRGHAEHDREKLEHDKAHAAEPDPAELEDDLSCIRRECLEEIGYAVRPGDFICSAETFCKIPEKGLFHPIQTYYQCELLEKIQEPIEKDHQLVWLEPREAMTKLFVEQQRWAVEMYMRSLQHQTEQTRQSQTEQSLQSQTAQSFLKLSEPQRAAELFSGWQETIVWSCLQGVMGSVYADRYDAPQSAAAVLGDFCFLAGWPSREFLDALSKGVRRGFVIMVPQNGVWGDLIETSFGHKARKITRFATRKDTAFDQKRLRKLARAVPAGMELRELDQGIFQMAKTTSWCVDWVSQYETYEDYRERGIGVVLTEAGAPVSGASSYSSYDGGIEIEIDTREDCRRQGFARVCGAALILRCLREGLYPSWDAHNEGSLALAEQLGYVFDRAYTAYEMVFTA